MGVIERTASECSDDIDIRPLELSDIHSHISEEEGDSNPHTRSENNFVKPNLANSEKFFSVVYGLKKKTADEHHRKLVARMAWKNALIKIKALGDPWAKFNIKDLPSEKGKRLRYKASVGKWVEDEVIIKMEKTSFAKGAMRECFRMKKLSNFTHDDWTTAHNYVAKRYMDVNTTNQTYYDDVKLQMDAKLWGEEFNRHNPPKKVDIFQMVVLQLYEREGQPLFHVEHYIEGSYIKYNSNSGFVSSKKMRMTPHAFSHFTFERSGHELIVVDIQGVGDLYTDPQIHTAYGNDYGDGNLGTRGMALFFHSHSCNLICRSLGLSPFDLAPSEIEARKLLDKSPSQACPKTRVRGTEEKVLMANEEQRSDLHNYLRQRSMSSGYATLDDERLVAALSTTSVDSEESVDDIHDYDSSEDSAIASARRNIDRRHRSGRRTNSSCIPEGSDVSIESDSVRRLTAGSRRMPARQRLYSSSSDCDSVTIHSYTIEEENKFAKHKQRPSRPSNVVVSDEQEEIAQALEEPRLRSPNTILGQVHMDMAKYHELNRFTVPDNDDTGVHKTEEDFNQLEQNQSGHYDKTAAIFHVMQAAHCGLIDGLLTAAQMHLGLPHYFLPDVELPEEERQHALGFKFMEEACRAGDRWAVVTVATAYYTGELLPPNKQLDWSIANKLFERAVTTETDDEGGYDALQEMPPYIIRAHQAEMLLKGGHNLERDPSSAGEMFTYAAELATEAMKGKLASKYYADAEEAWAQCEE